MHPLTIVLLTFVLPPAPDYGFVRAQEDFVIDCAGGAKIHSLPDEPRRMLSQLGSDCWRCRERSRKEITQGGAATLPWLFWGLRCNDAQVRMCCWLIIRDVASCRYCWGAKICSKYYPASDGVFFACRACGFGEWSHEEAYFKPCLICRDNQMIVDMTDIRF
jgi:hypothetical protein